MFPQPINFYEYLGVRRDIKLVLSNTDQAAPGILPLGFLASDCDIDSLCVFSQGRLLTNDLQNPAYYDYEVDSTTILTCIFNDPLPDDTNVIVKLQLTSPLGDFVERSAILYETLYIPPTDMQIEELTFPVSLDDDYLEVNIQGLSKSIVKDYSIDITDNRKLSFQNSELIQPNSFINITYGTKRGVV